MLFTNQIPHLKVFKLKTRLPIVNMKNQLSNNLILLNSKTPNCIKSVYNNPVLDRNEKYMRYYMDFLYKGKIAGTAFNINFRSSRAEQYKVLQKELKLLPVLSPDVMHDKNAYVDLYQHNKIFFDISEKRKFNKLKKVNFYLDYIKEKIDDPRFKNYTKTMIIDVDEWCVNIKSKIYSDPVTILYYLVWKQLDDIKSLGNINFILFSKKGIIRINPSELDNKSYNLLKLNLPKLHSTLEVLEDDSAVEKIEATEELVNNVKDIFMKSYNLVGDTEDNEIIEGKMDEITSMVTAKEKEDTADVDVIDDIINNEELNKSIYSAIANKQENKSRANSARDELLRKEQAKLKIDGKSLEELKEQVTSFPKMEVNDVSDHINTLNRNMGKIRYKSFDKVYNEKLYNKDVADVFTNLNDKTIPVFVREIKKEDTSDNMNYKDTWTIHLEDSNRKRHTIKVDMPKLIDDSFIYLNGNRSIIIKQQFPFPIFKSAPDTVQIVSDYNKVFLRREGAKLSATIEKLKKAFLAPGMKTLVGDNTKNNLDSGIITTLEYDEMAKNFSKVEFPNFVLLFNQKEVQELESVKKAKLKPTQLCIGYYTKATQYSKAGDLITIDANPDQGSAGTDFWERLSSELPAKNKAIFEEAKAGKKFVITTATIMKKRVPLIFLLGFLEGLTTVLKKAGIKYYFTDKQPKEIGYMESFIKFKNGYLVYETYPVENTFLMNAFSSFSTQNFDYEEFDEKEVYLDIFEGIYGAKNISMTFINFYNFMIDTPAQAILKMKNLPYDFVGVSIYANRLLADNQTMGETYAGSYRIRGNELITAYLFKEVADAYSRYLVHANSNNGNAKISLPKDCVLKDLLTAVNVEPYSTLNPTTEMEKMRTVVAKGLSGQNLEQSYTPARRSFDKSMTGILTLSTSPDGNVGVVRTLTLEPTINNARGLCDLKYENLNDLKDVNLFGAGELVTPMGRYDDSIRESMALKQAKHLIPVNKMSPVLISNGAEQVVPYYIGNDFCITAKDDGKVVEVDEKLGLIVVSYKDGTHQAIDTNPQVVKNGAGGFLISKQMICKLKQGQTIKKNDVLAYDSKFFRQDNVGTRMNLGTFCKVACFSSHSTFEDAMPATSKMASDLATEVTMEKKVVIGKNSNVDYIVKVGDKVSVEDDLIRFEDSYDEGLFNTFLSSVGEDTKEAIKNGGKHAPKSHYNGVIENIIIQTDTDIDDMSPSLGKIVKDYYNGINKKKKLLDKYDKNNTFKCGILFNESTEKIDTSESNGKINGEECIDSVIIRFRIKYKDNVKVGDKACFFGPLKGTVSMVIPEGYEPYTKSRPNEEISSYVSPNSILARQVPSVLKTMLANKVLVELKRKLQEIYEE